MRLLRKPGFLKARLPSSANYGRIRSMLSAEGISTVCEQASCPNLGECWDSGTATFLILGETCTRKCLYCGIKSGRPSPVDPDEPMKIARIVKSLGLRHAVITSVTRDDLPDHGAGQFAECVRQIRKGSADCRIELLIPDLNGDIDALQAILQARPFIAGHNIEVPEKLFRKMRPGGDYMLSLSLLRKMKEISPGQVTKSGFMVGLGEDDCSIRKTIQDLHASGVDMITIGQYLQPSRKNAPVKKFYTPDEFRAFGGYASSLGFRHIASGPLVRSSYRAQESI